VPKDRSTDRHPDTQTNLSARLPNEPDIRRFDEACAKLGLSSRRQGVITAIRDWIDKHVPETTQTTEEQQWKA
jgi:hypothetical protein